MAPESTFTIQFRSIFHSFFTVGQVNSPAIQAILEAVFPKKQRFLPTVGRNLRRELATSTGDACTAGATLSIEDNNFDSTGCYVDTAIDDGVTGFMYRAMLR